MKELQPLEADHSKLKANFAGLRNQPLAAKSQEDGCEISLWLRNGDLQLVNFVAILHAYKILLSASRYLRPTFLDFFALDI